MSTVRSDDIRQRIKGIVLRRQPELAARIEGDVSGLPRAIRLALVDVLSDELAETGWKEDGEPNSHGLELERLIDACKPAEPD